MKHKNRIEKQWYKMHCSVSKDAYLFLQHVVGFENIDRYITKLILADAVNKGVKITDIQQPQVDHDTDVYLFRHIPR